MIEVCCAVIIRDDECFLVAQRSALKHQASKWEFPGGKVEAGETPEHALVREIKEELDVFISIKAKLKPVIHRYPTFKIKLIPFVCRIEGGEISLKEHAAYKWLKKESLKDLDWAEADLPIVEELILRKDFL